jgi:hypothetical protein
MLDALYFTWNTPWVIFRGDMRTWRDEGRGVDFILHVHLLLPAKLFVSSAAVLLKHEANLGFTLISLPGA